MLPDRRTRPHEKLINFVADRPGHDRRYAIDASKIRRELGWNPRHDSTTGFATRSPGSSTTWWWERIVSGAYRGERLGLPG